MEKKYFVAAAILVSVVLHGEAVDVIGPSTYVSNLGNRYPASGGIGDIQNLFAGKTFVGRFSTGAGSFAVNFVSLEFLTAPSVFAPQSWTNVTVQLYRQVAGQYVLLGGLGNPVIDPTPTQWPQSSNPTTYTSFVDFGALSTITLDPSSQYLVAASASPIGPSTAAGLLFSTSFSYTTPTDWRMGQTSTGTYDGTTIGNLTSSFEPLKLAVGATPVPEPTTMCLVLAGCAAFALRIRCSRRHKPANMAPQVPRTSFR